MSYSSKIAAYARGNSSIMSDNCRYGNCSGTCSGDCGGECSIGCSGHCSTTCSSDCGYSCANNCTGSCEIFNGSTAFDPKYIA